MKYSIVIPVYRSGPWLEELAGRIEASLGSLGEPFELILVNDSSPDAVTWPKIEELARRYTWVRGFDLLYNTGQFRAILCGLEQARGDYIITMDDDLQHPPEELPKLIEAIQCHPEVDCVMGRYETKNHSWFRNVGSRVMLGIMNRLYDKPAGIQTTSFRIMRREFAQSLTLYRVAHPQLGPLIVRLTRKVINVPVQHSARRYGASGYRLGQMTREVLQSIVNASIVPLRMVTIVGLASAGIAFVIGTWYLARKLLGGIGVPGFASIILAISFFSGMILLSIGVLGEYIGRIIQEITGMPRYVIRKQVEAHNE